MITQLKVEKVIGKTFADKLDEVVFSLHRDYSRRDMVEQVGCANFVAAAKLAKVLKRLQINTAGRLYRLDPASLARSKGIGEACIFVAMCILDYEGYDVMKWWGTDSAKFSTVKKTTLRKARKHKQDV